MNTVKEGIICSGALEIQDLLPTLARHLMWLDSEKCREAMFMPVPTYALRDRADEWWYGDMAADQLDNVFDTLASLAPAGMYLGSMYLGSEADTRIVGYFATPAGGDK